MICLHPPINQDRESEKFQGWEKKLNSNLKTKTFWCTGNHSSIMKKSKVYNAISNIYLLMGILIMCGSDRLDVAFLSVICFVGAWGYNNLTQRVKEQEKETTLSNQWYESGQYPDY